MTKECQLYRVTYEGSVIIEDSRDPEHDASRELLRRGIRGKIETRRRGIPHPCMILDIEKAARYTVKDNKHGTPVAVAFETILL